MVKRIMLTYDPEKLKELEKAKATTSYNWETFIWKLFERAKKEGIFGDRPGEIFDIEKEVKI